MRGEGGHHMRIVEGAEGREMGGGEGAARQGQTEAQNAPRLDWGSACRDERR